MKRIATRAGEQAVLEWGKGDDVVICLHGFPDVADGFEPLALLLAAAGWRVVAPYLRGYAPSTLEGPYRIDRLADDVIALAAAVAPDAPVRVVGHDWGALASGLACLAAPHRFAACVTMAVPHPAAMLHNLTSQPAQLLRSWYTLFFQLPLAAEWALRRRDFALVTRLWRDWSPGWEPPPEHLERVRRCLDASLPAPIEYYRVMGRALLAGERAPDEPIRVPTLALHGARDGCVGPDLGRGQERFYAAGFRAEVLPDVGHFLHLERPAAVADRILEWLGPPAA